MCVWPILYPCITLSQKYLVYEIYSRKDLLPIVVSRSLEDKL